MSLFSSRSEKETVELQACDFQSISFAVPRPSSSPSAIQCWQNSWGINERKRP
uniref:Uncharacterized protein n=1 Tax=Arundo donax TaxID=35708 RepID=A0A0A9A8L9_ARUDO